MQYSAQAASCDDSSTNSLYIKASSYFDKVNLSNTNKEVSVERNDIRTLDIINITSCGSYYVAATHQSLLYKITVDSNGYTEAEKL